MCGLLGYIGSSKDRKKTEAIITSLFKHTQVRGMDASGFYCSSEFDNKKIFYHKQIGNSSDLISNDVYKRIWNQTTNLGLFHCRAASIGVGLPSINKNNHPFVSKSLKKAIIHNGLISRGEYNLLKNYYDTETDCDSEIVLRILEQDDKSILENIGDFLSFTENSQFAVAYAECHAKARKLFLFRNQHRPLYYADFRNNLGQIIFFSTLEILFSALDDAKELGVHLLPSKIVEMSPLNIYEFQYDEGHEILQTTYQAKKISNDNSLYNKYKITECDQKEFYEDKIDSLDCNMESDLFVKLVTLYQQVKICEEKIKKSLNYKMMNKKQYKFTNESINKIILEYNYIIDILEGKNHEF